MFDALASAGVPITNGYKNGGRNKALAKKEVARYVCYKPRCEVDPTYTKKRAVTVTEVYNEPHAKESSQGKQGRYIDKYKPLILYTAMSGRFQGTRLALFDQWGVFEKYKDEQAQNGLYDPKKDYIFNLWAVKPTMAPGVVKYCQRLRHIAKMSLVTALNSLQREGILEWHEPLVFVPVIEAASTSYEAYNEKCEERYELVRQLAEEENCILRPELFHKGLFVDKKTYEEWYAAYTRHKIDDVPLPGETASASQRAMYENYELFICQAVLKEALEDDAIQQRGYCPVEEIPSKRDIFNNYLYELKYKEVDRGWKSRLLGWEQVRREVSFSLTDAQTGYKYLNPDLHHIAFELGRELIRYIDERMSKIKLYYPKSHENDFIGLGPGDSNKLHPLETSKSAMELHNDLKRLFQIE